jgi:hypothetical protein
MTVYRVYKIKSEVIRNERKNCTICYTSEMSEKIIQFTFYRVRCLLWFGFQTWVRSKMAT